MKFVIISAILAALVSAEPYSEYKCGLCKSVAQKMIDSNDYSSSMSSVCNQIFPDAVDTYCRIFSSNKVLAFDAQRKDARTTCQRNDLCPIDTIVSTGDSSTGLEVRISKGLGNRPYNTVRLSVISNHTIDSPYFTYSKQFQNAWVNATATGPNVLNTGIVTVTPGETTTFVIENQEVKVTIPAENSGTRGIILADPCFQSEWITCSYVFVLILKKLFKVVNLRY